MSMRWLRLCLRIALLALVLASAVWAEAGVYGLLDAAWVPDALP